MSADYVSNIMSLGFHLMYVGAFAWASYSVIFGVRFGVFGVFLPNIIKIDLCNFEQSRFKVGAFFETQCSCLVIARRVQYSVLLSRLAHMTAALLAGADS